MVHTETKTPAQWLTEAFTCGCVFEAGTGSGGGTLNRVYCPDHGAAFVELAEVGVQWGAEAAAEWAKMRLEVVF